MSDIFGKKNGNHSNHNVITEAKEKYSNLVETLEDAALQSKKAISRFRRVADEALFETGEKIKDQAVTVDRQAHKNPWAFIGGAALTALAVGILVGRATKKQNWQ
jgi:ElaB/YqjD/DUF883 family membrane-anchored ribosome-binding protein